MQSNLAKTIGNWARHHWIAAIAWPVGVFFVIAMFLDYRVSDAVRHWPVGEQNFFHWLTQYGEGAVVLVPALVLWLVGLAGWRLLPFYWWRWSFRGLSALSLFTFGAVGIPGLIAAILKRVFGRARPVWLETEGVFAFSFFQPMRWDFQSFPSGHATTSLAFALAMTLLFRRFGSWVFIPAILIAFSRIVVGMHYLSDVLFGAALGLCCAWAMAAYWREKTWIFAKGPGWRNRFVPVLMHQYRRVMGRAPQIWAKLQRPDDWSFGPYRLKGRRDNAEDHPSDPT